MANLNWHVKHMEFGITRTKYSLRAWINLHSSFEFHWCLKYLIYMVARAGFEPAKLYAEDLESTPFDRSGTSPVEQRWLISFLTIPLLWRNLLAAYSMTVPLFSARFARGDAWCIGLVLALVANMHMKSLQW